MNPRRLLTFSMHFLLWSLLYLFWIFALRNRTLTFTRTLTVEFCYLIFIAAVFYVTAFVLIPRFLARKKIGWFIASFIVAIFISTLLRTWTAELITHYYFPSASPLPFLSLFGNSLLTIFCWSNMLVIGWIIFDRFRAQQQLSVMEKERIENELKFLRSQNNPHFLFNSLNTIYFQIDRNNHAARETLMKFSDMLRYQLYDCSQERIPVEKEMHYLQNYISLQQLRMDEQFQIEVAGHETIRGFSIAPLLILPLVENAFKHAAPNAGAKGKISIRFHSDEKEFHCRIRNPRAEKQQPGDSHNGIGLENVRRRLALLYPDRHRFEIEADEQNFSVSLTLKTHEDEMPHRG